jgi:uncharacterized protein (DUF1501 family)
MNTVTKTDPGSVEDRCGCPQEQSAGLSRRGMFRLAGAAGVTIATTASQARVAFGAPTAGQRVLVVVSTRGGMDGLNLVPPIGDPDYARARPSIHIPASRAIRLDSMFGLHPALKALSPLWTAKQLAIVQAAGMPTPNRSHFSAMARMEEAAPGSNERTGWIDRMIGLDTNPAVEAGINIGSASLPHSFSGPVEAFGAPSLKSVGLRVTSEVSSLSAWQNSLKALHAGARPDLLTPLDSAFSVVGTIGGKSVAAKNGAKYPNGDLGSSLKDVAALIRLNVGLQVATVDKGHWDMHANAGGSTSGWLFESATELAESLAAFAQDLGPDFSRVTVITLSEFGRRVQQNGSGGTDHGYGNAVMVLGGSINGGKVYGRWPGLKDTELVDGDLAVTTDYRAILADVLRNNMGVSELSKVFPGYQPAALGIARA